LHDGGGHTPETIKYGIGNFIYKARRPFHPQRLWDLIDPAFCVLQLQQHHDHDDHDDHDHNHQDHKHKHEHDHKEIDDEMKVGGGMADGKDDGNDDDCGDGEDDDDDHKEEEEEEEDAATDNAPPIRTTLFISPDENHQRVLAKRASPFVNVIRSKGFIWLATRPQTMGDWSQAGLVLTVGHSGPWFCELPEELWPNSEGFRDAFRAKFTEDTGDKRQELVWIGQFQTLHEQQRIQDALNECLLTDEELQWYNDGYLDRFEDPWEPWGRDDDEEEEEEEDNDEEEDEAKEDGTEE
jgi:G3E family GTPase